MRRGKTVLKKVFSGVLVLLLLVSMFAPSNASAGVDGRSMNANYESYLMAPLKKIPEVTTWATFENDLRWAKQNGFTAITVDFWWGDMEKAGDQQFDFSYAQAFAKSVRNAGMKMIPIISTHQCGGNVGDDCNTPVPSWVWNQKTDDSLYFKSETGTINKETLNPFATDVVTNEYGELYTAFAAAMAPYKDVIHKIYLSGGPAGELRYPSYTNADGSGYPNRGKFQVYTEANKTKFRNWVIAKYGTLSAVNTAWGTTLTATTQINPPSDGYQFLNNGYNSNYGKDFLAWYQGGLEAHIKNMGTLAHQAFDTTFGVPIGAKIAGIHWLYNSPTLPHGAEKPAGYNNYSTLLDAFKTARLDLTFTCLEMDDAGSSPAYSMPKTLVAQVANLANAKGIVLNGENALTIGSDTGYSKSAEMAFNYNFRGFTLLRYYDVIANNALMDRYREILGVKPVAQTIIVKGAPTVAGDVVHLLGNRPELGQWNTNYSIKLTYNSTYGDWRGTVYFPQSRYVEFKALIKSSTGTVKTWEPGSNNVWNPVPTTTSSFTVQW